MKTCGMAAMVLAACWLCGCTTEPAYTKPESNPYLKQGRIQYESSTTKYVLEVVRIDAKRTGGGLLKVIVTFRNTTKQNLWADVRTTFLDKDAHVLEQTNWEAVQFDARTVTEYTCTSLSSRAGDYQIIVKKPKKTRLDIP